MVSMSINGKAQALTSIREPRCLMLSAKSEADRFEKRLRLRPMRGVHGYRRGQAGGIVSDPCSDA